MRCFSLIGSLDAPVRALGLVNVGAVSSAKHAQVLLTKVVRNNARAFWPPPPRAPRDCLQTLLGSCASYRVLHLSFLRNTFFFMLRDLVFP